MKKKKLFMLGLMGVASAGALGLASCDTTANPLFEKVETKVSVLLNYGYDNLTENVEVTKNSIYTPKSLTREGYRFAGWYFDQAYTQAFVSGSAVSTSINLYAKWEVIEMVTIKYVVEGNDYASTTFEKGNPSVRIPNPEKTGYTFVGWYLGEELFDADKATTNVTVEARFAINTYNVSFDLAGGTADSIPTEAVYNTTITLPTPTKQGFTFKEFVDGDGNKYAAGATVTIVKETTFRAVFEALPEIKTVRITLNYTDGRENVVDEIVKNSAYQTSAPTRTGYQFAGWYLDEGYQSEFSSGTEVNSNITLYAKWNINKYEVVINANGGKILNEDNYIIQNVEYNTSLNTILNNIEPIKENYVAVGFSLEENGEALTAEELASNKVTSATTIYVVWAETVEVTLDFNGGSLDELDTKTIRVKKNSAVEGITPVKSGYTLAGWSLEADGEKLPADYVVEANVTLYAVWEIIPSENNITITLKKVDLLTNKTIAEDFIKVINKGEMVANVKIFYDDYYIASVADEEGNPIDFFTVYQKDTTVTIKYIKKNYTFKNQTEAFELKGGYAANEDGTIAVSKSLNDENNVKFSIPEGFKATINVAYKTAKAPAEEKSFSIKVLYNDDVTEGIAITSENTDPQTVEAIIYATNNTNDVFIGRQGNTSGIIESISVTLEALEPVRLTVVDGDATKTIQAYKDMAYANFLGEFNKKGYYVEYYSDESFTTLVPSAAVINADQTIYIKNTLIDYDVVFVDGTNQVSKTKMHYGDVVTKPEDLEKQGYRFIGWYDAEDENQTIVDFTNLKLEDKSVTYVAKWVEQFVVVFKDIKNETLDVKTVDSGSNVELPEAPEVEGYDFVGWVLKDTEFTGQNITTNLEVNAVYKIKTYNITLNLDGGDVEQALPTSVKHGTEITLPELTKDGYEFLRYEIGNGIYNALDKITVTSDLEIVAKWEEKPGVEWVHVTLNYNVDNYANQTKKVQKGSAFNTPEPLRGGYKFAGWYSDENLQTEFVSGSNIESDMTLYAKWKEIFSVTFMLDGSNYLDKEAVEGDKVEALDRDPERDEDVFEAWYADEACTTLFDFDKPITANTIIYGKWKFKVTFEGLEGTAFVSTNGTLAIPNGIPTKDGFAFIEWIDADKAITADTEIKAKWLQNKWVLTSSLSDVDAVESAGFIVNNVSVSSKKVRFSDFLAGETEADYANYIAIDVTKSGLFEFDINLKWQTKNKPQLTVIYTSNGQIVKKDSGAYAQDAEVEFKFSALVDANTKIYICETKSTDEGSKKGSLDITSATIKATYGEIVTVTFKDGEDTLETVKTVTGAKVNVTNPTKDNYDFVGWFKDEDLKEEFDLDDAVDGNLTLYAKFEAKKFTLTIHGNGGNATATSKDLVAEEIPYGSKVMELKASSEFNPSKEGYVMLSLALTADGLPLDEDALNALTVDGNLELFIVWTKTSTITFVDGNTTHTHTLAPAIQNTIEKWPDKVVEMAGAKEGYEFVGWFIDDNTEFTLQTEITDDLTVTAKWIELFKVTYYAGSDKFDEQTVKNGNTATKPTTTPTKENHDFKYWSLDITANDVVEYDFSTTVTDNVDLYAYFELVKHDVTIDYAGGSLKDGQTEVASKVSYGSKITLPELVKAGFEFLYYQYGNEQLAAGAEITVLGDVKVTAVWEAKAEIKNVTYHYNYKSSEYGYANKPLDKVVEIAKGEKYSTTETPTRDEYDFGGWYIDENLETPFVDESTIEDDVNLYAKWTIKKFSVTFYGNGGVFKDYNNDEVVTISNIEYGTAFTSLDVSKIDPKKTGYYVGKLSYTPDGENVPMEEFRKLVFTDNVEIYFHWELVEYTISYSIADGTNSANNPTKFTIETEDITLEDATRTGYTFAGWYTSGDYREDSKIEKIVKGTAEYISLNAKWTENKYTIAFDANGGTGTMNSIEDVLYSDNLKGLLANEFARPGYEFLGWGTTADGGVSYWTEHSVSQLTAEDGATVTLYAQWELSSVMYTFGGQIVSTTSAVVTVSEVNQQTTDGILTTNSHNKANGDPGKGSIKSENANLDFSFTHAYATGGQSKINNNSNDGYDNYITIDLSNYSGKARVTVYAKGGTDRNATMVSSLNNLGTTTNAVFNMVTASSITKKSGIIDCGNTYYLGSTKSGISFYGIIIEFGDFKTVTFDVNGGTGTVDSQIVKSGDKATAPAAETNPTKEHYTFAGWGTKAGEDSYGIYNFDTQVYGDLVLYAAWLTDKYEVTFNANSGEFAQGVETTQTVKYNEYITTQVEPTRTGYTFAGWFDDPTAGNEYTTTTGAIEDNITLYAHWTANDVAVTLNANGGKFDNDETSINVTAKFGSKVALAPGYATPESSTGAFVRWTLGAAADSTEYDIATVIDSETAIVLYAQYASSVTVTFKNGTATYETRENVKIGDTISAPTDPTKVDHYTFGGWYTGTDAEHLSDTPFDFTTEITGELVLYAKWNPEVYTVTFDKNGGAFADGVETTQQVTYNEFIATQAEPTQEGYVFAGWFDTEGKEYTTTKSEITENITLVAKWYDTVEVSENQTSTYNFTTLTTQSNISSTKQYGDFSISKGEHSQFKEQVGYISLFIGNTISFVVEQDGAVFMIAYNSNNTSRKVILSSTNANYETTTKYSKDLTSSKAGALHVYQFNGENITLEASEKGWLIFDNLKKGNYTVTFDTDESKSGQSYSGVPGKGEQKIERLKLLDVAATSKTVIGLTVDATNDAIPVVSNVKLSVLGSEDKIALTASDYKVYVDGSDTEYDGTWLTAGEHTVTIKYGKYTACTKKITVPVGNSDDNCSFDFTKGNVTSGEVLSFASGVVGGVSGDGYGAAVVGELTLNLKGKAYVFISGYYNSSNVKYTVTYDGDTTAEQNGNYVLYAPKGGTVTITGLSGNYLQSVSVLYPTKDGFSYDVAGETSTNSVSYQYTENMLGGSVVVDTRSGKIGANNSSWAQFTNTTKIYVYLKANQTLSIGLYTTGATIKYSTDGTTYTTAVETINAGGITSYTPTTDCMVLIESTADNNYISTLSVTSRITENKTLVFYGNASEGQTKWDDNTKAGYKDGFTISGGSLSNPGYLEFKNNDKIEFYVVVPTGKKAVLTVSYYNDLEADVTLGTTDITGIKDTTNSSNNNFIYTYELTSSDNVAISAKIDQNYLNYISVSFVDAD